VHEGEQVVGQLDAPGVLAALQRLVDGAQDAVPSPAAGEPEPSAGARG
jgi:hypothetical protein